MPVPCAHFWAERLYAKETYCEESDQGGEDSWKGLRTVNLAKAILEELSDKKAKKKCFVYTNGYAQKYSRMQTSSPN